MITIGIDGNEANIENRVGVNKYAYEMLWGLSRLTHSQPQRYNLIVYLKNRPHSDLPKESESFKYKILPGGGLWIITKLMPYLWRNPEKVNVLFSPSHYTVPILPIPRVCSIMDLGYLESSEHFEKKVFWQLKYWTAISVWASKRILSISGATKKDIVRHYPFASNKIIVTHLGYDREKFRIGISEKLVRQVKNKYSIVGDYILFVSTLKPSKNVEGLIEAYSRLLNKKLLRPAPQLVIAGKKGWMFWEIYKKVEKLSLQEKVIFTDYFPEDERPALMAGCLIYVLPSFWEGFGIEVLSAFGCGKPAVISNVGSLPEVGGDAAIYVNPYDVESIVEGMEKVLNMPQKDYNKLVQKGFEQAKKFSWEKCSQKTLEVLEEAIT